MKVLDLFSGIGGFSLGLERAGMETVAFCEQDNFCQKILKKHWPKIPIYNDVRSLNYEGRVDLICGGYPCQPESVAGNRKGKEDDRWLWPFMFSIIKKHKPNWVIGENVAGHISMGLDTVINDLESEGYTTRSFVIPACAVNAKHRRDRVWVLAYSSSKRQQRSRELKQSMPTTQKSEGKTIDVISGRIEREWPVEPNVGRVADGVSRRMDRLKSLGNAVVPKIVEIIGLSIMEIENA